LNVKLFAFAAVNFLHSLQSVLQFLAKFKLSWLPLQNVQAHLICSGPKHNYTKLASFKQYFSIAVNYHPHKNRHI